MISGVDRIRRVTDGQTSCDSIVRAILTRRAVKTVSKLSNGRIYNDLERHLTHISRSLLSRRRSRQRERLYALNAIDAVHLFVCLSIYLSQKCIHKNAIFSKKN